MDTTDDDGEKPPPGYRVGKGKPDKSKSWSKGQSGNPSGRPRGRKSLKAIVKASARRTRTVTRNGRKQKLTTLELGMLNLELEVARGSQKAFRDYVMIIERHLDQSEIRLSMQELTAQDRALLDYAFSRTRQKPKKGDKS